MKRLIIFIVAVCVLIGAAIAAAPFIAASDLAKRRIATQIEEWTGHPVTFVGEPRVKLFPFLSLTIEDAKIGEDPGSGGKRFVEMDKLTCKLRLLPFLIGRAEVAEFQLVRPHFQLTVDETGSSNWIAERSSIASGAVGATGSGSPGAGDAPAQIAEIKLGRFKIIDGSLNYDNAQFGHHEKLSAIAVDLKWPEVSDAVSGTGAFTWRDELVEFNSSINQPLRLIAGDTSPARFAIASKPIRVSFTGAANSLGKLQIEGEATVSTPSVRRVIEWLGAPMGEGSILGAGLIEGNLNWIGPSIAFPDARIELDGNQAEGAISVDFSNHKPRMQGTLALERLDLSAYLETFQARVRAVGPWQMAPINLSLLNIADLDIRLSAGEILLSSTRVGKTAAAIAVEDGTLSIDIAEAQFYGGLLRADGDIQMINDEVQGGARVTLTDTPAGVALADLADLALVDGTTAATIEVTGSGETWGDLAIALKGTADLAIADGTLVGFELGQLAALSGGFGVVDPAAGSGTVPINSLKGTLTLSDGLITSDNIRAVGETFTIDLGGEVSLFDERVRATGVLNAARAGTEAGPRRDIPFVVSGSWIAPLLLPDYERLIRRGADKRPTNAPPVGSTAQQRQPNG